MKHREEANKLANKVAKMANGSLKGYPLEGAVSKIEKALEKAEKDALEELAKYCERPILCPQEHIDSLNTLYHNQISDFIRWYAKREDEDNS